jgi:hypothetical protein
LPNFGLVVVDDFHRLPPDTRNKIADLLKLLADNEEKSSKLVIVGINQVGYSLIQHAPDLVNRIDAIKFEVEPEGKIESLIKRGERALNIELGAAENIAQSAGGSFYLAQLLCHNACVQAGILEASIDRLEVRTLYSSVKRAIITRQEARFGKPLKDFARGTKFRPIGRAPYLHILRWLAESDSWSINLKDEMARHSTERISVSQVVDKGYLENLTRLPDISDIVHFNPQSKILSVEDPALIFYLRNIDWGSFIRTVGFTKVDFPEAYDLALSFAGEDRPIAEQIRDSLEDLGHTVFYDFAEQHRIIAKNIEAYLAPIYSSGSRYVVAVLGPRYGQKRWTLFESDQYKHRIERGEVIPIWSTEVPGSAFDSTRDIGGLRYDPAKDLAHQAMSIAATISRKLAEES